MIPLRFILLILSLLITQIYVLHVAVYNKNLMYAIFVFSCSFIFLECQFQFSNHRVLVTQFVYTLLIYTFILIILVMVQIRNNPGYLEAGAHFVITCQRLYIITFMTFIIFSICFLPSEIRDDIFAHFFPTSTQWSIGVLGSICTSEDCPFYYYFYYVCCIISPLLAPACSVIIIRVLSRWNRSKKLLNYIVNLLSPRGISED